MATFIVKIFPLCAVLLSVVAYLFPGLFTPMAFLIVPMLGVIMLGMGATLSGKDFLHAVKRPAAVLIGMTLQFLLMPLLAWLFGRLLNLPKEQFIGLVMVGTVAGGTASNVIAYLAGGDVALSITMTACSTVAGIVLTPLISSFYLGQTVPVPAWDMFKSILQVVAVPVAAGLVINRIFRKHTALIAKICPVVSVVGIVLVIAIVVALNAGNISGCGPMVMLAVFLHNGTGIAAGYYLARLCRCDRKTAVTIAIEVGMQNSGLAAALSKQFFGVASALPGAIFSIWHNLSGALFAGLVHRLHWTDDAKPEPPRT
ncbi:MAG: bile acid:sodium symporter family protein [Lentisphaeria bacterium]|nr:bile acid:sodium symporter family protein [Lentisphaeria bacterium]